MFIEKIRSIVLDPPVRGISPRRGFYPSDASVEYKDQKTGLRKVSGSCLRKQYYNIKDYAPTESGSVEGTFKMEMGSLLQALLEDKLKRAGLWIDSEVRIWHEHMKLSGRLDVMSWHPDEINVPVGIEIKSISTFHERGLIIPSKGVLIPRDSDLCQMIAYLDYFGHHSSGFRMSLIYIARDSMKTSEHIVRLVGDGEYGSKLEDDKRYVVVQNELGTFDLKHLSVAQVYNRWKTLSKYLKEGTVPPRDYAIQYPNATLKALYDAGEMTKTKKGKMDSAMAKDPHGNGMWLEEGDWQCAFCDFKTECWTGVSHHHRLVLKPDSKKAAASTPVKIDDSDEAVV